MPAHGPVPAGRPYEKWIFQGEGRQPGDRALVCRAGLVEQRVMVEGSFPSGGALIPIELSDAILRNVEQYGIARQWARVFPMRIQRGGP